MIVAKGLTKWYGDHEIFTNVDLKIGNGRKVGLVGKNGCGKSTLFKVLNGLEESDAGNIEKQNEVFGYIPQEFSFPEKMVGEYFEEILGNRWDFYKVEMLVAKLKFTNFDEYQFLNTMSEGQKMKVKLIEMFLAEPTTLFIDEPTNHLDIDGIMWFEEFVKSLPITVIMISHDREFLNHTVDEIWEIDNHTVYQFVGDYDNYRSEKLKLINKWDEEYTLFLKKKAQLEQLLENVHKIKDGKKRGKAVSSVKKRIEREIEGNKKEKYKVKKVADIEFESNVSRGKLILRFTDVCKSYGNKHVFRDLNFELRGKEKVWLCGPNGAGKTTMVKLIMNETPVTSGIVTVGENVKVGYFSQVHNNLDASKNLLEHFVDSTGCYFAQAYGYLSRFLFDRDACKKRVGNLSPGERARFAFSIFAYKNYDLLVLDEPDNHLDIETKEVLEKSLNEFNGAMLLVSHDRYFVERAGITRVLNLKDGSLSFYSTTV